MTTDTARKSTSSARKSAGSTAATDAVTLLKADHRQVEEWFAQFESARSDERKRKLAAQICSALTVHMTIEEEIFYPAFLAATEETSLHHEAVVEHAGARRAIEEIEAGGEDDEYFDAKVSVLAEMIKHHVKEEERSKEGMFAQARQADMDLKALGAELAARKAELEAG